MTIIPRRCGLPRSLAFVALAIVGASQSRAQQPARIDTAVVDSIIRHHIAEKRITGVSVGIMQHGAIVFARGYGRRISRPGVR